MKNGLIACGAIFVLMNALCGTLGTVSLEGEYKGHLQDVWMTSNTIWWAHTQFLLKTGMDGRIVKKAEVGGHHAGLEIRDGHLYTAVCAFNGEPRGATTPACHVMIGEYDAATLDRIEMHVLDINDRAGSLAILEDGTFLVGCLRPQDIAPTQVRFHHLDRDFKLIRSHVLDNVPVKLGIEIIKRHGDEFYLCVYGVDRDKRPLDFDTIVLGPDLRERRRLKLGAATGLVFCGEAIWAASTRMIDKETKTYASKIRRVNLPTGE